MVMSIERKHDMGEPVFDGCRDLEQVLEMCRTDDDVANALALIHMKHAHDLAGINVAIGEVGVAVHTTGCIPEHESHTTRTEKRVMPCPEDVAARCGNCILKLEGGEELLQRIIPYRMRTSH